MDITSSKTGEFKANLKRSVGTGRIVPEMQALDVVSAFNCL